MKKFMKGWHNYLNEDKQKLVMEPLVPVKTPKPKQAGDDPNAARIIPRAQGKSDYAPAPPPGEKPKPKATEKPKWFEPDYKLDLGTGTGEYESTAIDRTFDNKRDDELEEQDSFPDQTDTHHHGIGAHPDRARTEKNPTGIESSPDPGPGKRVPSTIPSTTAHAYGKGIQVAKGTAPELDRPLGGFAKGTGTIPTATGIASKMAKSKAQSEKAWARPKTPTVGYSSSDASSEEVSIPKPPTFDTASEEGLDENTPVRTSKRRTTMKKIFENWNKFVNEEDLKELDAPPLDVSNIDIPDVEDIDVPDMPDIDVPELEEQGPGAHIGRDVKTKDPRLGPLPEPADASPSPSIPIAHQWGHGDQNYIGSDDRAYWNPKFIAPPSETLQDPPKYPRPEYDTTGALVKGQDIPSRPPKTPEDVIDTPVDAPVSSEPKVASKKGSRIGLPPAAFSSLDPLPRPDKATTKTKAAKPTPKMRPAPRNLPDSSDTKTKMSYAHKRDDELKEAIKNKKIKKSDLRRLVKELYTGEQHESPKADPDDWPEVAAIYPKPHHWSTDKAYPEYDNTGTATSRPYSRKHDTERDEREKPVDPAVHDAQVQGGNLGWETGDIDVNSAMLKTIKGGLVKELYTGGGGAAGPKYDATGTLVSDEYAREDAKWKGIDAGAGMPHGGGGVGTRARDVANRDPRAIRWNAGVDAQRDAWDAGDEVASSAGDVALNITDFRDATTADAEDAGEVVAGGDLGSVDSSAMDVAGNIADAVGTDDEREFKFVRGLDEEHKVEGDPGGEGGPAVTHPYREDERSVASKVAGRIVKLQNQPEGEKLPPKKLKEATKPGMKLFFEGWRKFNKE